MLKLYNTLGKEKQDFKPLNKNVVGLYACGPTVYDFVHIGNLRTYIFEDILRRVLEYNRYNVRHIINITDVGHLVSDADSGEDKMLKALIREGKELNRESMLDIADYYTQAFKNDLQALNIKEPVVWCKATEHIQEQIDMVKKLLENGYAYETDTAVYFDTAKLKEYGELANLDLEGQQAGISVEKRSDKKNPHDFALWLKLVGEHKKHIMNWDSPWGKGFPGWHIECSAMSIKYLDERFDIHCGGTDHIGLHHTNERAQNIGAFGHPVVNFWMHGGFLTMKADKMSKSKHNFITLQELEKQGYSPLSYRYLCLNAHYRSYLTFSFEALKNSQNALNNLFKEIRKLKKLSAVKIMESQAAKDFKNEFLEIINNDLNMPQALALMWKLVKTEMVDSKEKYNILLDFDNVLGLGFDDIGAEDIKIPKKVKILAEKRDKYRQEGDFEKADFIRKEIESMGYRVEDTDKGTIIIP